MTHETSPIIARLVAAGLVAAALMAIADPGFAQSVPEGVSALRLAVDRPADGASPGGGVDDRAGGARVKLAAGERIAVWVEGQARANDPHAAPVPVGEAAVGEVVARFGAGRWFAWPRKPVVWTAPEAGDLVFALNGHPSHRLEGEADIALARLGGPGEPLPEGFAAPTVTMERSPDGIEVRYRDRAGFGLDVKTLRFVLVTTRGIRYHLASWVPPGPSTTVLPIPPPDIPLAPGIHTLSVTITDRVGNKAPPATVVFDAVQ
ncbi:MAG: hypothetical protein ACREMD_01885 [Gemmatimonadota bacterium]